MSAGKTMADMLTAKAMSWKSRALAAEAENERLNARNVEVSVLAHGWMVAHDKRAAGEPYDYPSPADVPSIIAERDRLKSEVEVLRFSYELTKQRETEMSIAGIQWQDRAVAAEAEVSRFKAEAEEARKEIETLREVGKITNDMAAELADRALAAEAQAEAYRLRMEELEEAHAELDRMDPDLSRGDQRILERFGRYVRGLTQSTGAVVPASWPEILRILAEAPQLPQVYRWTGTSDLEGLFDNELRHASGKRPVDYLNGWLSMLRPFAFATKDDSWGELEKLLCIVMRNYVRMSSACTKAAALLSTDTPKGG